jgi:phage replication-related protein YjqB (UPF0714/DUF867 family)
LQNAELLFRDKQAMEQVFMDERGDTSEFLHLGGPLGLLAMHGGGIEPGTEEIARFVANHSGASLYIYAGRRATGNLSLHRPSHGMELENRPLVLRFLNHVNTAISIHGHGRNQKCAYVGGLHQAMVQFFVETARPVLPEYEWISDPEIIPQGIRGRNPNNIVNLPPAQGMQLELPRELRQTEPTPDGKLIEPAGDALVLSQLLVRFVGMMTDKNG